jgi:alkylation response protein AidB-like acyl-CoA dehydrogenase
VAYEISDEQRALQAAVRKVVDDHGQPRASYDRGPSVDRGLWGRLGDLGALALGASTAVGGGGGQVIDQVLVAEQLGYGAAAVPAATMSALDHVLTSVDSGEAKSLVSELAQGKRVVVLGISASHGLDLGLVPAHAHDEWSLSGRVDDLVEGSDLLLVPVITEHEVAWFSLSTDSPRCTLADQPSLDQGQRLGALACEGAQSVLVGHTARATLDEASSRVLVMLAGQAVGAAERALEISVAHAKSRHQFGQPIGRFQAVKHALANMLIDVENARSAAYNAAWAIDDGRADQGKAVRMAKAVATENAVRVVHAAIQVHGGIGYTWEHELHLLLRRAKSAQLMLGDADSHFERLGEMVIEDRRDVNGRSASGTSASLSVVVEVAGDAAFLDELSGWLDANLPDGWGTPDHRLPRDPAARRASLIELQTRMARGRWVGIHWPEEFGGRSASLAQQITYHAELVRRGVPQLPGHRGITIVGPTLIRHGTTEQQQRFIDRIRTGEDLWAGGFSEPEAGSDLAALRTRGEISGDVVRINGQKIWTSSARWCNWIYTLVRTNPSVPKHEGISVVLVPLDSPGITVRPIRQIQGVADFNEVYFDDVEVPTDNILGAVDAGWSVNRTTLSHEHFTLFVGAQARYARTVDSVIDGVLRRGLVNDGGGAAARVRVRLAREWATSQLLLTNGLRNVARVQSGGEPGPEGSIMKIFGQEAEKGLFELALDLLGPDAVLDRGALGAIDGGKWLFGYLASRAATIGGGTSEIHRSKIGENVLGLPRDMASSSPD